MREQNVIVSKWRIQIIYYSVRVKSSSDDDDDIYEELQNFNTNEHKQQDPESNSGVKKLKIKENLISKV